jgi:hypothetical protein
VKETEDIQEPKNYRDDYDTVENRLDVRLHGDEAIHQPQKNAYDD